MVFGLSHWNCDTLHLVTHACKLFLMFCVLCSWNVINIKKNQFVPFAVGASGALPIEFSLFPGFINFRSRYHFKFSKWFSLSLGKKGHSGTYHFRQDTWNLFFFSCSTLKRGYQSIFQRSKCWSILLNQIRWRKKLAFKCSFWVQKQYEERKIVGCLFLKRVNEFEVIIGCERKT